MNFSKETYGALTDKKHEQEETYADLLKEQEKNMLDEQAKFVEEQEREKATIGGKEVASERRVTEIPEFPRALPTEFKAPADAIEAITFRDFKVYVAQNPYQHSPKNVVTYRALAFRPQDGKTLLTGHAQFVPSLHHGESRSWRSAKEALQAICGLIDRTAPLPRYDVPVPDYEGFKIVVAMVPPPKPPHVASQLFVGRATKDGLVIDEEGRYSQQVINALRIRIDRYVAFGLVSGDEG